MQKIGIATFILPGQEKRASELMSNPSIVITKNERNFAAKEGVILLYLEFEDNREEGGLD